MASKTVEGIERWVIVTDENGHHEVVSLDANINPPNSRLEKEEVLFYYSSHSHPKAIKLSLGEAASALNGTDFAPDRPTYLIVHGWHNDNTSLLNHLVGEAVLQNENCNLIVTDWSVAASGLYLVARTAVPVVGSAIIDLVQELSIDTNQLTLIGKLIWYLRKLY